MATDTTLNVRIDEEVKFKASKILKASGLTPSSAVRMLMLRIVEDEALPFDPTRPNHKTLKALNDARTGKTKKVRNSKDLIKKLNA
jgi:DNA-damage-inducible protein J